ncbi:MAG TPA: nuclease A inhibitor family protein [Pyrinomonadaceae bacterium]
MTWSISNWTQSLPLPVLIRREAPMIDNDAHLLAQLKKESGGLLVMSESDYPFEVVNWDGSTEINAEFLRSLTNEPADSRVEETSVEQFLASGQFERLERFLRTHLTDLKVYKVGAINIPVYIVGKSPEGNWLGLSTRVIQT